MDEMEELVFLKDIQARYHVGVKKARAMMKSMPHHESPLWVTVSALKAWESNETVYPATETTRIYQAQERRRRASAKASAGSTGSKFIVPRERPETA